MEEKLQVMTQVPINVTHKTRSNAKVKVIRVYTELRNHHLNVIQVGNG